MKIVKMSLVAAVLVGASAFAIDNVKVSGDADVFYSTNNGTSGSLFDKESSAADAGIHLMGSADLVKNDYVAVSTGAKFTGLTTMGLENNFVSNVWGSSHGADNVGTNNSGYNAQVQNASWFNEAWVALTAAKTTAKLGRMELDTPLAFTEKWSIEQNSFEGAVLLNTDLPDTTLVGAYIGNGNGTEGYGVSKLGTVGGASLAVGPVVNANGGFATYGTDGAYAVAAINNSWKPLTAQAWYYDVSRMAQATWLQADLNLEGVLAGAQYTGLHLEGRAPLNINAVTALGANTDSDAYAFMLGYAMADTFTLKAAYSATNDKAPAGFNTATYTTTAQSKLYTEAWWDYGYVTEAGASAFNISLDVPVKDIADFGVFYTNVQQSTKGSGLNAALYANSVAGTDDVAGTERKLSEGTLTATRAFGPLNATLAYSLIKRSDFFDDKSYSQIQAYLALNF